MMLIAWKSISQEDTTRAVTIPYWQAQQIALELAEKDRLEQLQTLNSLRIGNLTEQITTLDNIISDKNLQIENLEGSVFLLQNQLDAERLRQPKSDWFTWSLAVVGALGVGYIIGNLN